MNIEKRIDSRLTGLPIHYKTAQRENPKSLIVFMPSALPGNRKDRTKRVYSRLYWYDLWPNSEAMAFSDPALQLSEKLNGAWFIHPEHDVVQAIADITNEHAARAGIPPHRIAFYGSSLGGFGAIAAASCINGARAVAEIPQIDFANWTKSAVAEVEKYITGIPISEYRKEYPEQIRLHDRLQHSGRIPAIRLITNPEEARLGEQRDFYNWAKSSDLPKSGPFEFIETTEVSGHAPLPKMSAWSLFRH